MQRRKKKDDQDALNRQQEKPERHAKGNQGSESENRSQMKAESQQSRPVAPFNERLAQGWLQVCDGGPVINSSHECQFNMGESSGPENAGQFRNPVSNPEFP